MKKQKIVIDEMLRVQRIILHGSLFLTFWGVIDELLHGVSEARDLLERSFLSTEAKEKYKNVIEEHQRSFN
ncbi:MAG: hypothetical protein ACTHK8_21685 [Ginsengibacter sp.]